MRQIIYHVASSLDGFIARKDGTANDFLPEGEHVTDYILSLRDYDTVIMGRKTYEYGYGFGLQPGQPAYPHMMHYIFSKKLRFEKQHDQVKIVRENPVWFLNQLKQTTGSPIYLCGGGEFAGFLLAHQLIDVVKLKLNPVLIGDGLSLFGKEKPMPTLKNTHTLPYDNGVVLLTCEVDYSGFSLDRKKWN